MREQSAEQDEEAQSLPRSLHTDRAVAVLMVHLSGLARGSDSFS